VNFDMIGDKWAGVSRDKFDMILASTPILFHSYLDHIVLKSCATVKTIYEYVGSCNLYFHLTEEKLTKLSQVYGNGIL
jgi:hypothetical protein